MLGYARGQGAVACCSALSCPGGCRRKGDGMAAGHLQQLWGAAGLGLSRGALVGRFAALRPLGLLLPPQPRPLLMGVREAGGDSGLEANPFYEKYQRKIQELRK